MMRDFTAVPNALVRGEIRHRDGRRVSLGAQALYVLTLDYARGGASTCTASQETLARKLGVTVRSIRNWLRELEQLGLVSCERDGRNGTNRVTALLVANRQPSSGPERKIVADKEETKEEDNSSGEGEINAPARAWTAS
jgi:DNA-binding transcriptional ArsR family regulator